MKTITMLGLGTMGGPMAANLAEAGYSVRGYNRSPARAEPFVARGVSYVADPAEAVAGADAVLLCVADDAAVRAVLLESGALEAMAPGALLIDTGTTGLELFLEVAQAAEARGLAPIDAPITGSKLGAEGGKLTFMVGGPSERVEQARALFDVMGKHVVHAGERLGDGMRIKYCLNMTQAVVLEGVLEGYALARAQGLELEKLAEVFEHSAGKTGVGSFKTPYLLAQDFSPHFRLDLMAKDLGLALDAAETQAVTLPLSQVVRQLYAKACKQGLGAEDFLATSKLLGKLV